ncbi:hypothetical protein [Rhodalgimonas zhirmunskyi]|uniref:Uncharacterized protein n=1 Tax=Rhodalgimonas zhirmunskyi TaxID=2964767 RepID=A0AAJ1UCC0_9RHOB|nr:hypothetical protein [Rhodoalgimonas zhirmunskyi]MDQ2094908.1 hypothetical protein [Rhodoalgimonas zhirmunskyi]
MKKQRRWIKSAIETAKTETPALPWQRGARRSTFISSRSAPVKRIKSA